MSFVSPKLIARGWVLTIPVVLTAPLGLSVAAGGSGGLLIELSTASGVLAASLMLVGLVAVSRVRSLTTSFGIERITVSHRWLGLGVLVAVLVHVGLFIADDPGANSRLLGFWSAPARARAAVGATVCLLVICASSVFRRRLRLPYRIWRRLHVVLAGAAIVLTGLHVFWLRHLVSNPVMRNWYLVTTLLLLVLLANRWVIRPLRVRTMTHSVHEVISVSPSVSTLVLRPRYRWQPALRFSPGQFAWLHLPDRGPGSLWDDHPFSIASSAERPRRLQFTIRHVGDFTSRIARLQPGDRVGVEGPHGSFTLPERTSAPEGPVVLIAAGVGITPIMSMLRTVADQGERIRAVLIVAARYEQDLLFRDELARLQERIDLQVVEVLSRPPGDWTGPTGRIETALLTDLLAPLLSTRRQRRDCDIYVCGPPGIVTTTRIAATRLRVPENRLHSEQFEPA